MAPTLTCLIFRLNNYFSGVTLPYVLSCTDGTLQWCGNIDNPVPATERLLEFAQKGWKNKAFRQMTFGLYCPPMAFCQQAKVGPLPYTLVYHVLDRSGGMLLMLLLLLFIALLKYSNVCLALDLARKSFAASARQGTNLFWKRVACNVPGTPLSAVRCAAL